MDRSWDTTTEDPHKWRPRRIEPGKPRYRNVLDVGFSHPWEGKVMNAVETIDPALRTAKADFAAELTAVAYGVALRYMPGTAWLDLQLDLWHALADAVGERGLEADRPTLQ